MVGRPGSAEIVVLGADKWGIRSAAPQPLPEWKDIHAGWSNIYILKSDGHLLIWGREDYSLTVAPSYKILQIAPGSEHAVVKTETGDVVAWGWGEHGNCGPRPEAQRSLGGANLLASSKYIKPGSTLVGVGAGCATSWIIMHDTSS